MQNPNGIYGFVEEDIDSLEWNYLGARARVYLYGKWRKGEVIETHGLSDELTVKLDNEFEAFTITVTGHYTDFKFDGVDNDRTN